VEDSPLGLLVVDQDCPVGPKIAVEAIDPDLKDTWVGGEAVMAKGLGTNALAEEPAPDMVLRRMG
jgi:hypothetical protein